MSRRKFTKLSRGFTLVEILMAIGLGSFALFGVMRMMDNINTGLKSQKDIEMRAELFQVLQRVKNNIDCAATLAAPVSDGSPIEIYKRNASGVVLVGSNGSNFGRFSILANKIPGDLIEIKAASFITPPPEPRSMLSAPDSSFTRKKIGTNVWSWATTGTLMATEFSELSPYATDMAQQLPRLLLVGQFYLIFTALRGRH